MSFRNFFVVVFLGLGFGLGVSATAHAQLGVYGTYTANRLSGLTCFAPAPATCSGANGTVNPSGVQGGIYYDFKSFGPIRLGGDLRGGVARSNKSASTSAGGDNLTTQNSVMVGARAVVKTPFSWLKPYGEVAGGWARSDVTEPTHTYDNFAQYEGFVGADIHVLPVVDLRAIELGIGNMNRFGSGNGPTSVMVKTIAIGVVFHLP
jgi:hypothetical protein